MKGAKITYGVGDLFNGTFSEHDTFEAAKKEYEECIEDAILLENEHEEDGVTMCKEEMGGFYFIIKRTVTYDEDGDIESDDEEVIEGGDYDIGNMA